MIDAHVHLEKGDCSNADMLECMVKCLEEQLNVGNTKFRNSKYYCLFIGK